MAKIASMDKNDVAYVESLATEVTDENNISANVSSGSHKTDGMIVIPCTIKHFQVLQMVMMKLGCCAAGVTIKGLKLISSQEKPLYLQFILKTC